MEQSVEILSDWLNSHINQTIVIEKHELSDLDIVHFKLESVDYRSSGATIDDYLDDALVLIGSGDTKNKSGELVPLPQNSFEIAVSGMRFSPSDDKRFQVDTDRAKYIFSIEE